MDSRQCGTMSPERMHSGDCEHPPLLQQLPPDALFAHPGEPGQDFVDHGLSLNLGASPIAAGPCPVRITNGLRVSRKPSTSKTEM